MRSVQIDLVVPQREADSVYATISDFPRYPELAPAVRKVDIVSDDGVTAVSEWEVTFRKGLMRWVEEDRFDPVARRIEFRQLTGDLALFEGSWACADDDEGGTRLTFTARLDMGIPSLADALEPIAVRTLVDNITAIATGLLGSAVRVDGVSSDVSVPAAV